MIVFGRREHSVFGREASRGTGRGCHSLHLKIVLSEAFLGTCVSLGARAVPLAPSCGLGGVGALHGNILM